MMMRMEKILEEISKQAKKKLSTEAKLRLQKDLRAVCQRLEKKEYETSGIVENSFDVPDKTKQFFVLLDTYAKIGNAWSIIFKQLSVQSFKEVIDLCPGFTPKVELGLLYSGFKGNVKILDKDLAVVKQLQKNLHLFHPSFSTERLSIDLFKQNDISAKFIVGNHIFDDLILNYFGKKLSIDTKNIYRDEEQFLHLWNAILGDKQHNKTEIIQILSHALERLVAKNGYLCLSQYQSYMERMLGLSEATRYTHDVFVGVKKDLCAHGFKQVIISKMQGSFKESEVFVLIKS